MNETQINAIKSAVTESAEMTAAKNAGQWKSLAGLLNTPSVTVPKAGTRVAELGIYKIVGDEAGEVLLQQLEGFALSGHALAPRVKRILKWLANEHGADIGDALTQQRLLDLAQAGVLNQSSVNTLIAYGSKQVGKAASILGRDITPIELRDEVYGG